MLRLAVLAALTALPLLAGAAAGQSVPVTLTVANAAPFMAGGDVERTPAGAWRLTVDAKDGNGAEDLRSAEALLEGAEGPRSLALDGPALVAGRARFSLDVGGEAGLQWTAVRLRDFAGAEALVALPEPAALEPPGPLVRAAGASTGAGGLGLWLAVALLAAVPAVLLGAHRRFL